MRDHELYRIHQIKLSHRSADTETITAGARIANRKARSLRAV